MPSRFASRAVREVGPKPFSAEWIANPGRPPATRPLLTLPAWIPGDKTLSAGLVLLLTLIIAVMASAGGMPRFSVQDDPETLAALPAAVASPAETRPTAAPSASSPVVAPAVTETIAPIEPSPADTPAFVPAPAVAPAEVAASEPGAILPAQRVLTYYGHPHDENMGILGEKSKEEVLALLREEAATYEAVDPSRPVVPAFEVIATVAQRTPGDDGTYILDTDLATMTEFADFAEANGALLILDLQIGRGTVAAELEKVRPLLERPYVHLALDPEFAVAEGEIPGEYIGSLDAESIAYAQRTLAEMTATLGLPPKLLIVHQFREDMIGNKGALQPLPGVQLVVDADGYGAPELKIDVYNILVRDEPVEFAGIKIFYKQDVPVMSAAEILGLTPSPDVIIYQ